MLENWYDSAMLDCNLESSLCRKISPDECVLRERKWSMYPSQWFFICTHKNCATWVV